MMPYVCCDSGFCPQPGSQFRPRRLRVSYHLGYSFLQESANQLQTSFKHSSRRAFSIEGKGFSLRGKGREKAVSYLKQYNNMIEILFSSIHVTSGMPARGEEFRVLRWADTAAVQRNIFICQGRILLVFSYNKASQNSNNSSLLFGFPAH
jgi:hypothetical protein